MSQFDETTEKKAEDYRNSYVLRHDLHRIGFTVGRYPMRGKEAGDVVLAVGPGYATDNGEEINVPYKAGDYILVNHLGVVKFGEFLDMRNYKPYSIGLVTDDLVQGRVGNLEALTNLFKQV